MTVPASSFSQNARRLRHVARPQLCSASLRFSLFRGPPPAPSKPHPTGISAFCRLPGALRVLRPGPADRGRKRRRRGPSPGTGRRHTGGNLRLPAARRCGTGLLRRHFHRPARRPARGRPGAVRALQRPRTGHARTLLHPTRRAGRGRKRVGAGPAGGSRTRSGGTGSAKL